MANEGSMVYFELADVSGAKVVTKVPLMRLCLALEAALEGKFVADIRRKAIALGAPIARRLGLAAATAADWHSQKLIEKLCDIAIEDDNRFCMSEDTWLKMTVSLKNPQIFFGKHFCSDDLIKSITIRRNVVPIEGYFQQLRGLHRPREFHSRKVLQESRGKLLMQLLKERRKSGNRSCELTRELAHRRQLSADRRQLSTYPKPVFHNVSFGAVDHSRKLGEGAGGVVKEVVWRNCSYAMKIFQSSTGSFEIEKKFAESLLFLHPHIVQVFGGSKPGEGESEAKPCLLMELLDNTLECFLYETFRRRIPCTSRRCISRVEKLDLLLQIASAMRKIHQNKVVHGDLKLANILISTFEVSGNVRHLLAKVADFDTAVKMEISAVDIAPRSRGSPRYVSPELSKWRNSKSDVRVDCQSDVYSFGVIAYEILTERWAYDLKTLDVDKGKINIEVLSREEWEQYAVGKKKLIDCTPWRNLKKSRVGSQYFQEVIPLVERCLKVKPADRPKFSEILRSLPYPRPNFKLGRRKMPLNKSVSFVYPPNSFVVLSLLLYWSACFTMAIFMQCLLLSF